MFMCNSLCLMILICNILLYHHILSKDKASSSLENDWRFLSTSPHVTPWHCFGMTYLLVFSSRNFFVAGVFHPYYIPLNLCSAYTFEISHLCSHVISNVSLSVLFPSSWESSFEWNQHKSKICLFFAYSIFFHWDDDLYTSSNIIRIIKSRRMWWVEHVARMGERREVYRVLVGKP
jgi:hypothetical protein